MWRRILGWFRRRGQPARTRNPFPPEDSRHEAFEALRAYAEARGKRRRRAPGSELKELVLRETPDDLPLPSASRDLLKRYREQWRDAPPEEWHQSIHRLPKARGSAEQETDWAASQIHADRRRRGKRDPAHYYSAGERASAGEVDRTYDTERAKPLEGLGDEEPGENDTKR